MFSSISSWIVSIAGIVCISVIVELILPDGQMNKYIKGIMAFLITLVIILPLPKLLNSDKDYSNIFNYDESINVDENYLYQLNLDKLNSLQNDIEKDVEKLGYENVKIYISADIFDSQMSFSSITVDISGLVITNNAEHKNISKIKKDITSIILSHVNLDEEVILYDG